MVSYFNRKTNKILFLIFFQFMFCSKEKPEIIFNKGVTLLQQKKFKEAIPYLKKVVKISPSESVYWNLGIANSEINDYNEALFYWRKYEEINKSDWRIKAKIIQAYQALGDTASRNIEIDNLYYLKSISTDSNFINADRFCREQFTINGKKVFSFEYFDPQGDRRIYYRFSVIDEKGFESFYISLGSYDLTTDIARELGEISSYERAYHLDYYEKDTHISYGHFNNKLSYDQTRKMVIDILNNKLKPLSSSNN